MPKFPGNRDFHFPGTGMKAFPGFPGTGTGMDALAGVKRKCRLGDMFRSRCIIGLTP